MHWALLRGGGYCHGVWNSEAPCPIESLAYQHTTAVDATSSAHSADDALGWQQATQPWGTISRGRGGAQEAVRARAERRTTAHTRRSVWAPAPALQEKLGRARGRTVAVGRAASAARRVNVARRGAERLAPWTGCGTSIFLPLCFSTASLPHDTLSCGFWRGPHLRRASAGNGPRGDLHGPSARARRAAIHGCRFFKISVL